MLAPFAPAQGHGDHTGDHGATGHEDWPESAPGSRDSGLGRLGTFLAVAFGKGDQKDRVGHGHADRHDGSHERLEVDGTSGQPERGDDSGHDRRGGGDDHKRQANRLEVGREQEQDDNDGHAQPDRQPVEDLSRRNDLAADLDGGPLGYLAFAIDGAVNLPGDPSQIRAAMFAVRLTTRFIL